MPRTTTSELATLVAAARRDLEDVEAALARGDDRLVDDAVLALLERHIRRVSPNPRFIPIGGIVGSR
jgi:hypothetical protein